uniref:GH5_13 / GH5 n=1 Tax=uncultured Armatimonadetes bacterium TaxID=157466 RepID=A0A6J4HP70_9BACT|nr:GH5_13 / GH5 [uncultured Armatimonadetes bacterium]
MRWTTQQARDWYDARPWFCGFNYVTSTAVNSTDMWQADTFDLPVIERELTWAGQIGFNTCRVFLQYLVWEADPRGFLDRLDGFLDVADRNGLSTLVILFDDCAFAGKQPYPGPQDEAVPGVHNSGWTPSPGHERADDAAAWPRLEAYAASVVGRFAQDKRVLGWDLYNEPGNGDRGDKSLPLLNAAFAWARAAGPTQPLTTGVWAETLPNVNAAILEHSDVISFHDYNALTDTETLVARLREHGRPVLCTEWMRRTFGSHFDTHLPFFRRENIGCWFWGLVNGRTQTHFPWGSPRGATEPSVWFHDLLRSDGTPHQEAEVALIREHIGQAGRRASPGLNSGGPARTAAAATSTI